MDSITEQLLRILIWGPPLILSLTLHELAHGHMALRLGDPTAKNAGRLSLNPLRHLDIIGALAFIFLKVGWAKPVPVNPAHFRNPQRDMLKVALAGPATNLILALICAILRQLLMVLPVGEHLGLAVAVLWAMVSEGLWINVMLAVFNLLPIPPLDGSRILTGILPPRAALAWLRMEPYGFLVILALFWTGVLGQVLMPIIYGIVRVLQP